MRLTGRGVLVAAAGVGLTTLLVAVLERDVGVPDASSVYLVAVVVSAMARSKLAAADLAGDLRDLIVTVPGVGYRIRD